MKGNKVNLILVLIVVFLAAFIVGQRSVSKSDKDVPSTIYEKEEDKAAEINVKDTLDEDIISDDAKDTDCSKEVYEVTNINGETVTITAGDNNTDDLLEGSEDEGEPTIKDLMRRPEQYIGLYHHLETVRVRGYSDMIPFNEGLTAGYICKYTCFGEEYTIVLTNVENVIDYRLLEDDEITVEAIFSGIISELEYAVFSTEYIEFKE